LLSYGANPDALNDKNETPRSIMEDYSKTKAMEDKAKVFLDLFDKYKDQEPLIPRKEQERRREETLKSAKEEQHVCLTDYPMLRSKRRWTQDHPDYRSGCTEKRPNTGLLDGESRILQYCKEGNFLISKFYIQAIFYENRVLLRSLLVVSHDRKQCFV
jgi:hypothetical protein